MTNEEMVAAASDVLDLSFNLDEPEKAVAQYVGDVYLQHNPQLADGPEAFIGFVHGFRSQFPDMKLDIKRVVTQGDMVVTHSHMTLKPGTPGVALADFFRFEGGKLVEHWDVIQEIPETSANAHGMF
jgi:predicted SnoaL-like aldol condensation-catalyzing enzyme